MTPRDTRTGKVLEDMVLHALTMGGYEHDTQVNVGKRPNGRAHRVDAIACKKRKCWLVSLKWQQVSGTAEQKVPFEVMCLSDAVAEGKYQKAYLVLGGEGWTLREFYTSGKLARYLPKTKKVKVVTLENFVGLANQGKL